MPILGRMNAIERAIKCFGSQAAMASALGVKQPTISEWLRGDRQVPAERCPIIERETRARGQPVLCEELRPDIAWGVLREQVAPTADGNASADAERAAAADRPIYCFADDCGFVDAREHRHANLPVDVDRRRPRGSAPRHREGADNRREGR